MNSISTRVVAINSAPWPGGLYPVSVRAKSETGRWLTNSQVRVTPARGIWYDSRETLTDEWHDIAGPSCRVNLLLEPGTYEFEFKGSARGDRTMSVVVDDPYAQLVKVPWKHEELWIRDGTWDQYISRESSYRALTMQPGDVVADMGAHIGVFARRAHQAGVARVVCWEPEPINCEILRRNLDMVGLDYELVQACVVADSIHEDGVDLWMDPAGDGDLGRTALHSMMKAKFKRLALRVPAVRWSEELNRVRPDVLKVDVEGAELDYDWSLVPSSVREIAVELERARSARPDSHEIVAKALRELDFELIQHSSGWSVMECWRREL